MFDFIKIQYELGKITAEEVRAFCPKWITEKEVEEILNGNAIPAPQEAADEPIEGEDGVEHQGDGKGEEGATEAAREVSDSEEVTEHEEETGEAD